MLAGHDMIAKAPTGTGKTVAFGIPILQKAAGFPAGAPKAVVLSPTRELAQQIAQDLTNLAQFLPEIRVVCVYGGAGLEKQQKQLKAGCQIVVATPGRLMDHYRHHALDLSQVTTIVLDEADEMLNMGFYKDVRGIIDLLKSRESLSMFSATISREVLDIGWLYQHNAAEVDVQPVQESSPKIAQYKLLTTGRDKLADLAQIIISKDYKRVMVFCNTKYNTGMLANQLARLHFNVDCLHGDLSQNQRDRVMKKFREGTVDILIATDVAARGIDVDNITHVINFDIPQDPESYVHRIGRTGRAGNTGVAMTFITPREFRQLKLIERIAKTKIKRRQLPTAANVIERQRDQIISKMQTVLELNAYHDYMPIAESLLDEYSAEEVAAAALKLMQEGNKALEAPQEDIISKDLQNTGGRPGMVRLFMNVGRSQKIMVKDIVSTIAIEADIPARDIGLINIYDKFTFVEVPEDVAEKVIGAMHRNFIKGYRVNIEPARVRK